MFKKISALLDIAIILLLFCGCTLLYMPYLDQGATVYITPDPEYTPPPPTADFVSPSSLGADPAGWPQEVLMAYADYSSQGSYEEQCVTAEKVYGQTDSAYIGDEYVLYLPEGFSNTSSQNSIGVAMDSYENYRYTEKACTGFYLLVFDSMEELRELHQEAYEEGFGPAPEEYTEQRFGGYTTLVYTRTADGKTVYHHDLLLTGADPRGRTTIMRFSYVEGFEKSAENMLWVAETFRLLY